MAKVHAIGWSGLFSGFSGKDDKKVDWTELLPFPLDDALANDKLRISQATAVIFVRLHRKGLIPPHVVGALTPLIDEIESLTGSKL